MGKAPAFQFYPNDWMMDTRMLSLAARGAWIDLLGAMWHSQTRGMLTLNWIGYARLLGVSVDQAKTSIGELIDMHVCDYETEKALHETQNETNKTFHATECNGNVTLICRRMFREANTNKNSTERVRRHRMKRFCNADVTPPSSSSSSSSTTKTKTPHPALSPEGRGGECVFDPVKGFEEFFSAYPKSKFRMTAKTPAEYAYIELIKVPEQHAALMAGLERHKKTEQWREESGKYIPNPERFLRECRWQDVEAGAETPGSGSAEKKKKKLEKPVFEKCQDCGVEYAFTAEDALKRFRLKGKCGRCANKSETEIDGKHGKEIGEFLGKFGKR